MTDGKPAWVFGYGSLIWRPDMHYLQRQEGWIEGWTRRFWQGSTDHRGVPGAPGRVVTLHAQPGARCWGVAYRLAPEHTQRTLIALDHREKGGYGRHQVTVRGGGGETLCQALMYLGTPDNPDYLGPATVQDIARQAHAAAGPSGANREYVLRLAQALERMQAPDPHVQAVAAALLALD